MKAGETRENRESYIHMKETKYGTTALLAYKTLLTQAAFIRHYYTAEVDASF